MQTSRRDHLVSTLGELEFANALKLRRFRKEVTTAQAGSSAKVFEKDLGDGVFQLQPLTEQAFEKARQLSRDHTAKLGIRTADLLHVAAALDLHADRLYTFDEQQRKLAHTVRLKLN
ncbi:MAG: type II toxin-antitoxin system VapC family toxin [Terriglobales bacterium]